MIFVVECKIKSRTVTETGDHITVIEIAPTEERYNTMAVNPPYCEGELTIVFHSKQVMSDGDVLYGRVKE